MADKKYWWYVKRIKDDPIRVTESQGKQIAEAWEGGAEQIKIREGLTIQGGKNITSVEASFEPREDNVYKLAESIIPTTPIVVTDMEGNVATTWYKKWVSGRQWDSHYSHIPAYRLLERNGEACLLAVRIPQYAPAQIHTELEQCNLTEVRRLETTDV